jgi:selenium-binding protein 1
MNLRPDPTFHATPKLAMQAPVEKYAFTVMLSPDGSQSDGIAVVDLDPKSETYGQIVHQVIVPYKGDEFHHFGWNACSSSLSPLSGHAFSGAPLSDRAGHPVVENLHYRRQGTLEGGDSQDHRT